MSLISIVLRRFAKGFVLLAPTISKIDGFERIESDTSIKRPNLHVIFE